MTDESSCRQEQVALPTLTLTPVKGRVGQPCSATHGSVAGGLPDTSQAPLWDNLCRCIFFLAGN